ncbi:hypothetical protein ACFL6T_03580 [Candidatus Zixiibacteriota bacterium]
MTARESKTAIALIALSLLLVISSPQLLSAQVEEPAPGSVAGTAHSDSSNAVTPGGALLRSALLPGWGQIYTGHKIKGAAMIIADAVIIGLAIHADTRVKDLAVPGGDQIALDEWRNKRENRIMLAVGLILYSMADAFVDAHFLDFDSEDSRFGVEVEPPPDYGCSPGIRISLTIPFGRQRH